MRPINREKEKLAEDYILKNYEYNFETGQIFSNIGNKKEIGSIHKPTGRKIINIQINNKDIKLKFHRVCWLLYFKTWPTLAIDHIDRNPLNNSISNLRLASDQQNNRNVSKRKTNTSGFKNVRKNGKGWQVMFRVDNKSKCFGTYSTKEEANKIARKIEKKLYKEFAPIEMGKEIQNWEGLEDLFLEL